MNKTHLKCADTQTKPSARLVAQETPCLLATDCSEVLPSWNRTPEPRRISSRQFIRFREMEGARPSCWGLSKGG